MNNPRPGKIGEINEAAIKTLGLSTKSGTPIFIERTNINHMLKCHNNDYIKYGCYISQIIDAPDYVGINPKDNSIEYIKKFSIDDEFVKVAVRVSVSGVYFVRSIYIVNKNRVHNFISKGTLKPLTKQS